MNNLTNFEIMSIGQLYRTYIDSNRPSIDWLEMDKCPERDKAAKEYRHNWDLCVNRACEFVRLNLNNRISYEIERNRIRNIDVNDLDDPSQRKELYDEAKQTYEKNLIYI